MWYLFTQLSRKLLSRNKGKTGGGAPGCCSTAKRSTRWGYSSHSSKMVKFYTHGHTSISYFRLGNLSLSLFLSLSFFHSLSLFLYVITKITGSIMEHREPQSPWGFFSSQTKIALLWVTTDIRAKHWKYQRVDHFYKLCSIHVRD